MTEIITLNDGLEIEVEVSEDEVREISDDDGVVDSSIEKIQALLTQVMQPISNTFKELNKDVAIESTKVTIGVKVGVTGNFILAKSSIGANIQVEMTLKPTSEDD